MHRFHATLFSALFATSAAFASAGESFDLNTLDPETLAALRTAYDGASDEWLAQNIGNIHPGQEETTPSVDPSSSLSLLPSDALVALRAAYPHATDAWLSEQFDSSSLSQVPAPSTTPPQTDAPGLSAEDQERVSTLMSQFFDGTFSGGQSAITPTEETPAPAPALPLTLPSVASISALPAAASVTFEQALADRAHTHANEHAEAVDILNTPAFRAWLEVSGMADDWPSLTEASRLQMAEIYRTSL